MSMMRRDTVGNALTWLHLLGAVTAAFLWLGFRIVHHVPRPSGLELLFSVLNVPVSASLVSAIGLGLVTAGLLRRKRIALLVVLLFQVVGVVWAVLDVVSATTGAVVVPLGRGEGNPVWAAVQAVVAVALIVLALWLWPAFPARVTGGSWLAAATFLVLGMMLAVAATAVLVHLVPGSHGAAWQQTIVALLHAVGLPAPRPWHTVRVAQFVPQVASLVFGLALLGAVMVFLRSARSTDEWNPDSEVALRELLDAHGEQDSLGYVATRRDKLVHFGARRRAAISYAIFGGVCLASGDPIGDPAAWDDTIRSWERLARGYGWTPAVLACSEQGARAYVRALGFDVLRLGDEAVLSPEAFNLESTSLTEVRRAWRRVRRDGVTVSISRQADLAPEALDEVRGLATQWREGDQERGFSMELGRLGDPADGRIVVVVARDAMDEPLALLTFLPWGRSGLSLDLMRRSPAAPNGINEFLVAELMAWCRDRRISRVSLNFAVLRHVFASGEDVAAAPLERWGSGLLRFLDRFWQVQRLYRANAKFRPAWQPRYVVLGSPLNLPAVATAALVAEGFLPDFLAVARSAPSRSGELGEEQLARIRALENPPAPRDLYAGAGELTRQRLAHLAGLRERGQSGYPVGARDTVALGDLPSLEPVSSQPVAGRLRAVRDHGGVCFADLTGGGRTIQLLLEAATVGRQSVRDFVRLVDRGDLVEVRGRLGHSRNGTPALLVDEWTVVAKSLRPIPWGGLRDASARARDRSLDLIVHPDQVGLLKQRSRAVAAIRRTMAEEGFTEVETPILGLVHGGASARPFRTHSNAHDTDLVLRIAPELSLKKLVVGGLGPIFEIGRNFRNEGVDASHNPEFTSVEAYQPWADYHDMRRLAQRAIQAAAVAVHGTAVMPIPDEEGRPVPHDISGDWPVVPVVEAVSLAVGRPVSMNADLDELLAIAQREGVPVHDGWGPGAVLEALYEELVEPRTRVPTFYVDFPAETSPLTAPHRSIPGLVERWDLVAVGMELGTAYSELTDPLLQRQRLVEQSWKAAAGDPEAMEVDESFLAALELGMPPSGGLGLGIDRVVMALTGTTIRQVLALPFVRAG